MRRSIKLQLSLLLGFLIVLLAVYHIILYFSVEGALLSSVDKHLEEDAKVFELSFFLGKEEDRAGDLHLSHEVYAVRAPNGLILDKSGGILPPFDENWTLPDTRTFEQRETYYRILTYRTAGGLYLQYGVSFTAEAEFLEHFRFSLLLSLGLLSTLVGVVYLLFFRSIITSIRLMSDEVVREDLREDTNLYEELKPMFNKMKETFQRLREQSERQQNVVLGLSHSVKTPLSTAILLLEDAISRTKDEKLRLVKEELWRLERNITSFLKMSKIEHQQNLAKIERYELFPLIKNVCELYGSKVELDMAEEGVYVLCDKDFLLEILGILLDNALLHGLKDSPITLRMGKSNKQAFVCVENMSETYIEEESFLKPFEGKYTGVGLYIANKLAQIMNCSLKAENQSIGDNYLVKVCLYIPVTDG